MGPNTELARYVVMAFVARQMPLNNLQGIEAHYIIDAHSESGAKALVEYDVKKNIGDYPFEIMHIGAVDISFLAPPDAKGTIIYWPEPDAWDTTSGEMETRRILGHVEYIKLPLVKVQV